MKLPANVLAKVAMAGTMVAMAACEPMYATTTPTQPPPVEPEVIVVPLEQPQYEEAPVKFAEPPPGFAPAPPVQVTPVRPKRVQKQRPVDYCPGCGMG